VLVVPVGAVVEVVLVVVVAGVVLVVLGAVVGALVVIGGEVNVGPADAGKPTAPVPVCCFGAGVVEVRRLTGFAL
jgi:hypothetical protein